jgi:hypothetical protein
MNKNELEVAYKNFISDRDVSRLELILDKPNIFHALRIIQQEIRHSNFLAWLLNPNENHGLGDLFLKRFLREILVSSKVKTSLIEIEEMNLDLAEIKREFLQIDILIEIENLVIIIENKIRSKEHSNQLNKYFEVAKKQYSKESVIAFVYLTLNGEDPSNDSYISISYEQIEVIISDILSVYNERLNPSILMYLKDYLDILKNDFMDNGEVNELSKKIYRNHKVLLDRLFEFKEDATANLRPFFEDKVTESGWVLGSFGRGIVRFLTPELDAIIPKRRGSWSGKESFLFELHYTYAGSTKIRFFCTISPGDEEANTILMKPMKSIFPEYKPSGKQWLTYINYMQSFKTDEWASKDPDDIKKYINEFWQKVVTENVIKVEMEILKYRDELLTLKIKNL